MLFWKFIVSMYIAIPSHFFIVESMKLEKWANPIALVMGIVSYFIGSFVVEKVVEKWQTYRKRHRFNGR